MRDIRRLVVSELFMITYMRKFVKESVFVDQADIDRQQRFVTNGPTHGWTRRFVARHGLAPRKKKNSKSKPLSERLIPIQNYLRTMREKVLPARTGETDFYPYGRYPLDARFNVDQVPLPFVVGFQSTWEEKGANRVWFLFGLAPGHLIRRFVFQRV